MAIAAPTRAPRAPRLPRPVARRIDRLARAAHRFHRFAHHPLCEPYRGEVIRVGRRTRLCRGCSYAALGGASGLVAGVIAPVPLWGAIATALAGAAFAALALLARPRSKWLTRWVPATGFAFACVEGLRAASLPGVLLALGVALGVGLVVVGYRARRPDRSPCESCPERDLQAACSGIRPIVRRERAFRRVAQRLINASELGRRVS